jgi:hypothetical protein
MVDLLGRDLEHLLHDLFQQGLVQLGDGLVLPVLPVGRRRFQPLHQHLDLLDVALEQVVHHLAADPV